MTRIYHAPPLREASFQATFSPPTGWDSTVPGLYYGDIRTDFPVKKEVPSSSGDEKGGGIRFETASGTPYIQVEPYRWSFVAGGFYPGWSVFSTLLVEYLKRFFSVTGAVFARDTRLIYLNKIRIPQEKFCLQEFFNLRQTWPSVGRSNDCMSFFSTAKIFIKDLESVLSFTFGTGPKPLSGNDFYLEIEIRALGEMSLARIAEWITPAHNAIETFFDGSFSEITHTEIFREVKNA